MNTTCGAGIGDLIAARRPGFSLDREFYLDPNVFRLEIERVFGRVWLYAGHVSDIPHTGDYFLYQVASEPLIIMRTGEGEDEVQAMMNVCRHRGSKVCLEPKGHATKLVCPYHAWVYDLDGRLLAAKCMPAEFRREDYALPRRAVRVVEGLIFVCLADEPPPFDPFERAIRRVFRPHGFAQGKICHRETLRIKCNWKIACENAWECYHCSHSHPQYCAVMPGASAFESARREEQRRARQEEWEAAAERLGHPVIRDGERYWDDDIFIGRMPCAPGFLTQSEDGAPLAPLMGDFRAYDGGISGFQTFPLIWFASANDHGLLVRLTPISVDKTEAQYAWLVRGDAVEGRDYDVDRVTWMWRTTAEQDRTICQDTQAGVQSLSYRPGPYSTAENRVDDFVRWYLRHLGSSDDRLEQPALRAGRAPC
jgi:phenylpropionate dioxygenase-like ring-hydroxylating dioxygenase large terminal subunit